MPDRDEVPEFERNQQVGQFGAIEREAPGLGFNMAPDPAIQSREHAIRARVEQIKNSAEGAAMQEFVRSNLPGNAQTQGAPEQIRQYYSTQDSIQIPGGRSFQINATWRAFKEIAQEILNNTGETLPQFVQRVNYVPPVNDAMQGEEEMLEAPPEPEQPQQIVTPEAEADKYAEPYLLLAQTEFMSSHRPFMDRHENSRDRRGNTTGIADAIFEAVEMAFGSGSSRGGNKKWKQLLAKLYQIDNNAIGDKVRQFIPNTQNIIRAIDQEILQSKETGEEPSSIVSLRTAIKSRDPQTKAIVEDLVYQCAKIISSNKTGEDILSMNYQAGEGGKDGEVSLQEMIQAQPEVDPPMDDEELLGTQSTWEAFISNPQNAEMIQKIRTLRYGRSENGELMVPLLVQQLKINERDLIKESINLAFVGWSDDGSAKWKSFFAHYPQLSKGGSEQEDLRHLAEIAAGRSEGLGPLQEHVMKSAYNFFVKKYEEKQNHLTDKLKNFVPNVKDLRSIQRMGRLSEAYMLRHYQWQKKRGMKNAWGSARRWAVMKTKMDALVNVFKKLATTNEPQYLTEELRLMRNPNTNQIVIQQKEKKPRGRKGAITPESWTSGTAIRDDQIEMLPNLIANEQWMPRAMERMAQFNEPEILQRDTRPQSPLTDYFDQATEEYRQQHPDELDRLKGFRLAMGKLIKQARTAYQGTGISQEQLADLISKSYVRGLKSRIVSDPLNMIQALEEGKEIFYSLSDLSRLADCLGVPLESIYTRPDEYDSYSVDDQSDLHRQTPHAFRIYGPYLVNRKKEAIRRGIGDDFFDKRTCFFYLSMMQIPTLFSSKPTQKRPDGGDKVSDQKIGKFLYQLLDTQGLDRQDGLPPVPPIGINATMEEVKDNLSTVPTEDVNDPLYKVPDFRSPRRPSRAKPGQYNPTEKTPSDTMSRYYIDPDIATDPNPNPGPGITDPAFIPQDEEPKSPNDIRRKLYQPDVDAWLTAIEQVPFKEHPRNLAFYEQRRMEELNKQVQNDTPEQLEGFLDNSEPELLARAVMKKIWPTRMVDDQEVEISDNTLDQMLEDRFQNANAYHQKKHGQPKFDSFKDFCLDFVKNEIHTGRYFREQARQELARIQRELPSMSTIDKIRSFVPVSVRRSMAFVGPSEHAGPGVVPLREVMDPQNPTMEKFDSSKAIKIVLAAMDDLDEIGGLHRVSTHFDPLYAPTTKMLNATVSDAVKAIFRTSERSK